MALHPMYGTLLWLFRVQLAQHLLTFIAPAVRQRDKSETGY